MPNARGTYLESSVLIQLPSLGIVHHIAWAFGSKIILRQAQSRLTIHENKDAFLCQYALDFWYFTIFWYSILSTNANGTLSESTNLEQVGIKFNQFPVLDETVIRCCGGTSAWFRTRNVSPWTSRSTTPYNAFVNIWSNEWEKRRLTYYSGIARVTIKCNIVGRGQIGIVIKLLFECWIAQDFVRLSKVKDL